MSESNERYEVRHYTDRCWPHTCAGAANIPDLIRVLWGFLRTPEEREAVRRAVGVTCVVAVAIPRPPQTHNDYSSAGTPTGAPDAAGVSVLDRAG